MTIHDWRVERSGAGMRIIGKNPEGEVVKLTKVRAVERSGDVTAAYVQDQAGAAAVLA